MTKTKTTAIKSPAKFAYIPVGARLIVRRVEAQDISKGGIFIPPTAQETPSEGEVLAVGCGTKDEKMTIKVGSFVMFGKYDGVELPVGGEKMLVLNQSDVLCVKA